MIPKRHRVLMSAENAIKRLKQGRIAGVLKGLALGEITRAVPCRIIAIYEDFVVLKK